LQALADHGMVVRDQHFDYLLFRAQVRPCGLRGKVVASIMSRRSRLIHIAVQE
jgi:hypothetical protein